MAQILLMYLSVSYPSWSLWLFLALTIAMVAISLNGYFSDGRKFDLVGGVDDNGLRRQFFFNGSPYATIFGISISIAIGFIVAVLLMIALGGVAWCLLWIVKIICYLIYYIGWMLLIGGLLSLFGDEKGFVLCAIPGGIIVYWGDSIKSFAELCVAWGEDLFAAFNVFGFAVDIVKEYWVIGLAVVLSPIALFLALAILWMTFALMLRFYDWATTRYYSVHHPCPYCQEDSEPAVYFSNGQELKTELRPGVYGLFHIVHPETHEKMPTLLINGRSGMTRKCCKCGSFINTETGVDKHIAMVGGPESGKTALTLAMIGRLNAVCPNLVLGKDVNQELKNIISKISKNGVIKNNEFPNKTGEGLVPSIRVNITREGKPPYALYINDIAGELFQPGKDVGESLKFLYNTTSLIFLIDPTTAILRNPGSKMKKWIKSNSEILNPTSNVEDIYASVRTHINDINRLDKMTITYVLVKADTGYLGNINGSNPQELKQFISDELGLQGILSNGEFHQEQYFAVSTIECADRIDKLNSAILEQQKIDLH